MDISEIECLAEVGWMNEDDLPEWVDDEVYNALYPSSDIVFGVRKFPYIKLCNKDIFLIDTF